MNLKEAILALDPLIEDHWTMDGLPRMDALVDLTGNVDIKRADVTNAVPGHTRDLAVQAALGASGDADATGGQAVASPTPVVAVVEETAPRAVQAPVPTPAPKPMSILDEPTLLPAGSLPGLEPGQSVLDMERGRVLQSRELTAAALGEIAGKITETQDRMAEVETELKQLYAKNDILTRASDRHERGRPSSERNTAVKDYLAGQAAVREMRSRRAREFVQAGTSVADVQEALRQKSKLDVAMGQGRASHGSQRPAVQPLRQ